MILQNDCARAEILAGAIALGEASDSERDAYRRHLSGCQRCIATLGGEREIERVMASVAQARDEESWEPDVRGILTSRSRNRRRAWGFGFGAIAAAIAVSLGIHTLVAAGITGRLGTQPAAEGPIAYNVQHIILEHRAPQSHAAVAAAAAPPARRLVVVHNVVTLTRPAVTRPAAVSAASVAAAAPAGHPAAVPVVARHTEPEVVAEVQPSEREKQSSIAAMRTAQTTAPAEQRAESLAVFPMPAVIRDVMPLGGESAIVPRPSRIAYDLGAEGTTAFDVSVDERGVPQKCTISKTSGYLVLDDAVCRAAMRVHYAPRTVNGRPVPGVYRDAFTFRSRDPNDPQP